MSVEIAGATHIGTRHANEDYYGYDPGLGVLAVADGVGTRPAGRIAAETAIGALFSHLTNPRVPLTGDPRDRIERAFTDVHRRVREQAEKDEHLRGMATTLACAMEHGEFLVVGHVGHSRVLRFRDDRIENLTTDHRLRTDLVMRSRLTPEEIERHGPDALTRAIGLGESIVVDVRVEPLRSGDDVIVATDGLTDVVDDEMIAATLRRRRHAQAVVDDLVRRVLMAGAPDNVTVACARWRSIAL